MWYYSPCRIRTGGKGKGEPGLAEKTGSKAGVKVIYYRDELNDEFAGSHIKARKIGPDYVYLRESAGGRIAHFLLYRIIAMPLANLYMKLKFRQRIIGREKLKSVSGGCFMYANHTQNGGDAVNPGVICGSGPDAYVVVHPDNVSMPVLGRLTPYMGALPLPEGTAAYRNFLEAIGKLTGQGKRVAIYPEAHIWPYYTGIRPFRDTSFAYPVKLDVPAFAVTNTYQARKHSKKPRIVTYIDGPFYPDGTLPAKARQKDLRDRVYVKMCERAKLSTVKVVEYIKAEEREE